jgi:hypothetical protein
MNTTLSTDELLKFVSESTKPPCELVFVRAGEATFATYEGELAANLIAEREAFIQAQPKKKHAKLRAQFILINHFDNGCNYAYWSIEEVRELLAFFELPRGLGGATKKTDPLPGQMRPYGDVINTGANGRDST